MEISKELVTWRAKWDLTREELSVLLGVSSRTIQGWELGRSFCHQHMLRRALRDIEREFARSRKLLTVA